MERIDILGNELTHSWMAELVKICEGSGEEAHCRNCNAPYLGYRYQTVGRKTRVGILEETRLWLWCRACRKYGLVAGVKMPDGYQEPADREGWWDGYREDIQRDFPHLAEEFQR